MQSRRNDPNLTSSQEPVSIPYEMISLQSMGAFMLFGGVDQNAAYEACEFIIKANILQASDQPLTFLINSEGGNVNDGFAVIDIMETSRLPVQTVGTGLIASMSLLILSAGHKGTRTITKNTEILAHQWNGGMEGKFHELMAVTNEHIRLKGLFVKHFLRHSNMNEKQINDVLFAPSDRWLTPHECKKFGLVDRVSDYLDIPKIKSASRLTPSTPSKPRSKSLK